MEELNIDGNRVYCISFKEYLHIKTLSKDEKKSLKGALKAHDLIYVEDRGILMEYQHVAHYSEFMYYILHNLHGTEFRDSNSADFVHVYNITPKDGNLYRKSYIYSGFDLLSLKLTSHKLTDILVERFLNHSRYLFRDPFDPNSKQVIYFKEDIETLSINTEFLDYGTICNSIKQSKVGLVSIVHTIGIYYICDDKLIYAKPEILNYTHESYCITQYYKCIPDAHGKIRKELLSSNDLSVIVDTISLFKYDSYLKEESQKALRNGNNLFYTSIVPNKKDIDNAVFGVESYQNFTKLVSYDNDVNVSVYLSEYSRVTTDFILYLSIDYMEKPVGYCDYEFSSAMFLLHVYHPLYVQRLLTKKFRYRLITTPFNDNYTVKVVDNFNIMQIADILNRDIKSNKITVIYDCCKDVFYYLSESNRNGKIAEARLIGKNVASLRLSTPNIAVITDNTESIKISWSSASRLKFCHNISYSFMREIQCRFKKEIESFDR